ncbi:hypothetical protein [Streptomyces sp. AcH 505]|uniref:hypothetical protein n=1 Tax=Streptomyces sp. AcH 505 TaxID=352211 RepID=UPI000693D5A2
MANWNLSVDLTGRDNDLSTKLRADAKEARALGVASRAAKNDIQGLGDASLVASGRLDSLGTSATAAKRNVKDLGGAATTTDGKILSLGTSAQTTQGRLDQLAGEAGKASRQMLELAAAAELADEQLRAVSDVRITATLDNQTSTGTTEIQTAITGLRALSPIELVAQLDNQTTAGIAGLRTAITDLETLGPVQLVANLDDETSPGLAAVREAIAALESMSPVQLRATVDDDTGPGLREVREAVDALRLLSPVQLNVVFDGDSAQITAAATAMAELRDNASRANTALTTLATRATAAAAALDAMKEAAQNASNALRTLRGRAAATAEALGDLRTNALAAGVALRTLNNHASTGDGRLDALAGRARTLRTDLNDLDGVLTTVGGHMGGLNGNLGGLGGSSGNAAGGMNKLMSVALMLAPALLPIAASIAPIIPLAGAAGLSVGAFGAALIGQISALTDAAKAEKAFDDAVAKHGAASKEAAQAETAYLQSVQKMPPATRQAAAALAVAQDAYKAWSDSLAGDTMPVVTKGLGIFSGLLEHLSPLAKTSSTELSRMETIIAGGMESPGFDTFMGKVDKLAAGALRDATTGVLRFGQALENGTGDSQITEFMQYARENGPLVGKTLKDLATAIIHLISAASGVGVGMLTLVSILAHLVNAVPTSVITNLLQLAIAIKAVKLAVAGGAAIKMAMAAITAQVTLAGTAAIGASGALSTLRVAFMAMSVSARIAVASTGIGLLVVALMALSDRGKKTPPDVDKLTTSLARLAATGKVSGEAARVFGKDLAGLGDSLQKIVDPKGLDQAQQSLISLFGTDSTPVKDAKAAWDGLDKALAGMVSSGHADQAKAALAEIEVQLRKQGLTSKEVDAQLDDYKQSIKDAAFEQKMAAQSMGLFGDQAQAVQAKLAAQKQSADGLRQSLVALNDVQRASLGGQNAFEAAIDAGTKALKDNGAALSMHNGQLDLSSEKARNEEAALRTIASSTDEYASSVRESGGSWSQVSAIYERGRSQIIAQGDAMGLTKTQASQLADRILTMPTPKAIFKGDITDLDAKIKSAQGRVDSLKQKRKTAVGADKKQLDAQVSAAQRKVNSLKQQKALALLAINKTGGAVAAARNAIASLHDRTINITSVFRTVGTPSTFMETHPRPNANGGLTQNGIRYFADGGENHVAQIAPGGQWRVWAEPETQGEAYIPLAPSKRGRSREIAEETVRRLGGKGIAWKADGGVTDFRYDPSTGSLYSASEAGSAGNKTKKVTTKVKGKKVTKEVDFFDLSTVESKLKSTSKATAAWNKDLQKVADLAGGDVADALASMGKDGIALTHKMATGSTSYLKQMSAALRGLAATAKASLTDYTREIGKATTTNTTFASNLAKLAGKGFGELAKQLAAQGDEAAQQLAAAAVADPKKAATANTAAGKANNALTGEQVQQLVSIIAAVKTAKTGIHDVAAATGLGEDDIISTATRSTAQIKSALGSRATKFLADLGRAQKHLSYADGGIRAGMYATQGGIVNFAEPSTGGEAYIPLGSNKRGAATKVLRDVAGRFGVSMTDLSSNRPVVVVQQAGDTHVTVTPVRSNASGSDIGAQVGRSVRRARRGGVAARA